MNWVYQVWGGAGERETGQEVWDPGERVTMVSDGPFSHT